MQINAAIQLLPIGANEHKYEIIDKAIALIQKSGLNYKVCPFETVVEGSSDKIYALIQNIQNESLKHNCDEVIINIKIHAAIKDLSFNDKLLKY